MARCNGEGGTVVERVFFEFKVNSGCCNSSG